jgi:Predicted membrane protein (DUF2232)
LRNLKAIEIAEGALLADVAVLFQLISVFLPVGGSFFNMLVFVVFVLLVLRRGLYVSVMGMCVALFMVCVTIGPQYLITLLIECLGGIFLGVTMKQRWHALPLVLVGTLCGALFLYIGVFLLAFLTGVPLTGFVRSIHHAYNLVIPFLATLATKVGVGMWWKQGVYPLLNILVMFLFTYWWITLYITLCLLVCPFVLATYFVANQFVRLLGYDVRPFPGGWLGRFLYRIKRRLYKWTIRRRMVRKVERKGS